MSCCPPGRGAGHAVFLVSCVFMALSAPLASAQTAQEGKNLSALARENLAKPRRLDERHFRVQGTDSLLAVHGLP